MAASQKWVEDAAGVLVRHDYVMHDNNLVWSDIIKELMALPNQNNSLRQTLAALHKKLMELGE